MTSDTSFELDKNVNKVNSDFTNGKIVFHSPKEVFYSGQIISGKLELKLHSQLTFTGIHVMFHGEAQVSWNERESEKRHGQTEYRQVKYVAHQGYFQALHTLVGGNDITHLPPGSHSFNFEYRVPYLSTSSYDGDKGSVVYRVVAYIDYPYPNIRREEIVKKFKVVAPLDLNKASPAVREPIQIDLEEVYTCCCNSDPVNVRVTLPVSGYCPGQAIPAEIFVDNQSSFEINRIILQLVEKTRYHSKYPQSEFTCPEKVLATENRGPILSKSEKRLICNLVVPSMIPVNLENCSIIDVGYFFKVTVKMTGCNDDMQDECEICLGLVPLQSTLNGPYTHPMAYELPDGPIPDPNERTEPVNPNAIPVGYPTTNTYAPSAPPEADTTIQYTTAGFKLNF